MGYLHIDNLYKNQAILLFKECYALEKIHGTSTEINWDFETKTVSFSSGGESESKFKALFDVKFLKTNFEEMFIDQNVTIYGEGYGGKQQGMSHTYGKVLKFIGFDVKVGSVWLNVPNAENVCTKLNLEFVSYKIVKTDLESLTAALNEPSVQAVRNGIIEPKKHEGIVLRPLIELRTNNGERLIAKYKHDEFNETKTKREISPEQVSILEDANEIAEEWVTPMRLEHVLQKYPVDVNMESMGNIIKSMIEDVYREGINEIIESSAVGKAIGKKTVKLFKDKLKSNIE